MIWDNKDLTLQRKTMWACAVAVSAHSNRRYPFARQRQTVCSIYRFHRLAITIFLPIGLGESVQIEVIKPSFMHYSRY